ncbi:hypothetical protein [Veronia pacifica]|uniref:hypothetical protein n=1 Tax=Veronia pacifica TaxID=1080227 RepID=UPI001586B2AD|nr:hypothetical protein [Veronia pacifica]
MGDCVPKATGGSVPDDYSSHMAEWQKCLKKCGGNHAIHDRINCRGFIQAPCQ